LSFKGQEHCHYFRLGKQGNDTLYVAPGLEQSEVAMIGARYLIMKIKEARDILLGVIGWVHLQTRKILLRAECAFDRLAADMIVGC
jgi:hypothetical protein